MKYVLILATTLISFNASAQVDSPQSSENAPKVKTSAASDTSGAPGIMLGFGLLPGHQLKRTGVTSTPVRIQVMGTRLYKSLGVFAAVEFASADSPFIDNSSDSLDVSTYANSYFRNMLGLHYTFGKFGAYAGIDLFSKNGFFRSVGANTSSIGSGRKTLGVTYNAYKGLTLSLDFSSYAGPGIGVNYLLPLNSLK
jgi:hypothetical protein